MKETARKHPQLSSPSPRPPVTPRTRVVGRQPTVHGPRHDSRAAQAHGKHRVRDEHGRAQHQRHHQPVAPCVHVGVARPRDRLHAGQSVHARARVPRALDRRDKRAGKHARVRGDHRAVRRGAHHRRRDTVDRAQGGLHLPRARSAGHAGDAQVHINGGPLAALWRQQRRRRGAYHKRTVPRGRRVGGNGGLARLAPSTGQGGARGVSRSRDGLDAQKHVHCARPHPRGARGHVHLRPRHARHRLERREHAPAAVLHAPHARHRQNQRRQWLCIRGADKHLHVALRRRGQATTSRSSSCCAAAVRRDGSPPCVAWSSAGTRCLDRPRPQLPSVGGTRYLSPGGHPDQTQTRHTRFGSPPTATLPRRAPSQQRPQRRSRAGLARTREHSIGSLVTIDARVGSPTRLGHPLL